MLAFPTLINILIDFYISALSVRDRVTEFKIGDKVDLDHLPLSLEKKVENRKGDGRQEEEGRRGRLGKEERKKEKKQEEKMIFAEIQTQRKN